MAARERDRRFRDPGRRAAAAGPDRRCRRRARLHLEGGSRPPRHRVRLRGPRPAAPGEPRGGARRGPAAGRRRRGRPGDRRLRGGGDRRRPVRRRHQRRRRDRADPRRPLAGGLARPRLPARGRGRPPLADRPPRRRPARAGGGGRARRRGADDRPLPAVLPVRDDRRLRRHPLGGPGLEWLRPLRRPRQLGPAADTQRRDPHPRIPAHRRRPRPARARDRVRGRLRRHPRRHRQGPPGAEGPPLRGLDRGELRGRHRDRPQDGPGAGPARRDPRLR